MIDVASVDQPGQDLLHRGCFLQVHAKTSNGLTALHNAASAGHMAVVQQLLEAGSSINARTASGTNALYNAATAGHVEAVQRLIDAGSELDVQAANGLTVLHSAASNGHCEVKQGQLSSHCITSANIQALEIHDQFQLAGRLSPQELNFGSCVIARSLEPRLLCSMLTIRQCSLACVVFGPWVGQLNLIMRPCMTC